MNLFTKIYKSYVLILSSVAYMHVFIDDQLVLYNQLGD